MGVSNLNEHSSRSHSIFSITVESTEKDAPEDGAEDGAEDGLSMDDGASSSSVVRVSTLNLVDLAGSETFAMNFGNSQQKETLSINKSLSALKDVIVALSKADQKFIPYASAACACLIAFCR